MKRKYIHTIQLSKNDCGIACIKMILNYYNYDVNYIDIKNKIGITYNGIKILELKKFFTGMGFESKVYRIPFDKSVNLNNISNTELPCIIMTRNNEDNHYIVLYKLMKKNKCLISNHDHPKIEIIEVDDLIKNARLILTIKNKNKLHIDESIINKKNNQTNIFLGLLKKYKQQIVNITLTAFFITITNIVISMFFGVAIDNILPNIKKISNVAIIFILIAMLGINLISVVLDYYKYYEVLLLNNSIEKYIYKIFINKLLHLKKNYYHALSSGEYIYRLKDAIQIIDVISTLLTNSILDIFTIIVTLIILINVNAYLTLIIIISILLSIMIIKNYYPKILNNSYLVSKSCASFDERIDSSIKTVQVKWKN